MLPAIGLMVGATGGMISFYIMSRMGLVIEDDEVSTGSKVFAVLTIVAALIGLVVLVLMSMDLITAATSTSRGLEQLQ